MVMDYKTEIAKDAIEDAIENRRGSFQCKYNGLLDAWHIVENYKALKDALEESVTLQSHYAELLNAYDGGERMQFKNADEWLKRLKKVNNKE